MIAPLLTLLLAAEPLTNVEEHAGPELGVLGGLALASGMAPGANVGATVGFRLRVSRVSFGLEGSLFFPGQEEVPVASRRGACVVARCVERVSSVAFIGSLPVCVHLSWFSACGVAAGGAATSRSDVWQPIFSAGARVAVDPHVSNDFSVYLSVQALVGVVRAQFDPWLAAPLQLGLTFGVLHASS